MNLDQLIPILQLSIAPVILISGMGLVLVSMTNRYARISDRARELASALRIEESPRIRAQVEIMMQRGSRLKLAIGLVSTSILLTAVLIITLFMVALVQLKLTVLIILLFISSMLSLIGGLLGFIVDINASMSALKLEMEMD